MPSMASSDTKLQLPHSPASEQNNKASHKRQSSGDGGCNPFSASMIEDEGLDLNMTQPLDEQPLTQRPSAASGTQLEQYNKTETNLKQYCGIDSPMAASGGGEVNGARDADAMPFAEAAAASNSEFVATGGEDAVAGFTMESRPSFPQADNDEELKAGAEEAATEEQV